MYNQTFFSASPEVLSSGSIEAIQTFFMVIYCYMLLSLFFERDEEAL
jgi:hypothetical protein